MKYVPKSLGDVAEISAGKNHEFRAILRVFLIVGIAFVLLNLFAIAAVEIGVRFISVESETEFFGNLHGEIPEAEELEAFAAVLHTLRAHPDVPRLPYRLELIPEEQPNAFAVIGGVIGITEGLVDALEDDEIARAFVLAHELGHFRNRDHLRGAGRALLLGTCLQMFSPYGGGGGIGGLTQNAILMAYSRKQEEAADEFGIRLICDLYGGADGAVRLMNLLHEGQNIPGWAYMFTTHPGPEKRIKKIQEMMEQCQPMKGTSDDSEESAPDRRQENIDSPPGGPEN